MKIHPTPPQPPPVCRCWFACQWTLTSHPTPTASQPHLCAIPRSQPTLCASLLSRNELGHFTRATLCGNSQENAGAQKRDADFVRACAVETRLDISQEPLYAEIHRKMPGPRSATQTLCEPAQSKRAWTFHEPFYLCGNLQEKCPIPEPRRRLCASLRSRNALGHFTSHFIYAEICRTNARSQKRESKWIWTLRKSHFMQKFAGKMPRISWSTRIKHRPLQSP